MPVKPSLALAAPLTGGLLFILTGLPARASDPPSRLADGHIVWQSTRADGRNEIYRARGDGTEIIRLTGGGGVRPQWSPDSRWIAYGKEAGGVFLMRPDGSGGRTVSAAGALTFWLHDNGGLVINEGGDQYLLVDPDTDERTPLFRASEFRHFAGTTFQPNAMTHDNRYLLLGSHLYINGYSGANGSFRSEFSAVAVDLLDREQVYFIGNGCWPFSPPAGDQIFHICGDCPQHPDVYGMSLGDLATRSSYRPEVAHSDADWGHEYNPRISTDGQWLAYMSSTGCHDSFQCDYEIFVHRLGESPTERTRITTEPRFDGFPHLHVGRLWTTSQQPRLLLTPDRITFHARADRPPAAQVVKLKNDGAGALGAIQAVLDPVVPWLELTTAATALTLRVRQEALTAGLHEATVVLSAQGQAAPVILPVRLVADQTFPTTIDAGVPPAGAAADGPGAARRSEGAGCGCALGAGRTSDQRSAPLMLALVLASVLVTRGRGGRGLSGQGGRARDWRREGPRPPGAAEPGTPGAGGPPTCRPGPPRR